MISRTIKGRGYLGPHGQGWRPVEVTLTDGGLRNDADVVQYRSLLAHEEQTGQELLLSGNPLDRASGKVMIARATDGLNALDCGLELGTAKAVKRLMRSDRSMSAGEAQTLRWLIAE